MIKYTQYHLIRTTFIRTKYLTSQKFQGLSVLDFEKLRTKKFEIVSMILEKFTYLAHKIIDFVAIKLSCPCLKSKWVSSVSPIVANTFLNSRIFWEGHKILRNLHLTFDWHYIGQGEGWREDFAKYCGLFRIYEL